MGFHKLIKSQVFLSGVTIFLLMCTYLLSAVYNSLTIDGKASLFAKSLLFASLVLLVLFLVSFLLFFLSMFGSKEVRDLFNEPEKISAITSTILICSYLSSVMNSYMIKVYGEIQIVSQIFLYLSMTFFVFFIILFLALLVSFSNKYFYSK